MFSVLRRRMGYANVVATLALVFAMSGGALAASKFLITSTKQIKPSVLAQLKGKAGKSGAPGAQGPAGVAGPAGPAGPQGPAGANGKDGAPGPEGKEGKQGLPGKDGTTGFTKELPKGETETGTWSIQSQSKDAENVAIGSISFPIPLESPLGEANVFFLLPGEENEHCKGTVANPEAGEGYLCVYSKTLGELAPFGAGAIDDPSQEEGVPGAGRTGANLLLAVPNTEELQTAYGTWAVTAG
jgi:collagen triple helix repeat protein